MMTVRWFGSLSRVFSLETTLNKLRLSTTPTCNFSEPARTLTKRPPSAFLLFYQSKLAEIKQASPGTPSKVTHWSKAAGSMWKALDDSGKQHYYDLYASQRKNYLSNLTQSEIESKKEAALVKRARTEKLRKRKEAKQLEKPKKPPTSHGLYIQEKSVEFAQKDMKSQKDMKPLFTHLSHSWKTLPESSKEKYVHDAKKKKEAYEADLQVWENKMIKEGKKHLVRVHRLKSIEPARKTERAKANKIPAKTAKIDLSAAKISKPIAKTTTKAEVKKTKISQAER